jgi:hypothetical protein
LDQAIKVSGHVEDEEEGSDENEENELEELQTERLVFFLFKRINM